MEYKYVVLTNTTIGSFMANLDGNIVLISLPAIIATLPGTSTFDGIWIIMGYTLVLATLLLTFGRLSDIFGRVRLYTLGFAVFTAGSALCSLAPNGTSLDIFRLVQGTGAALLWSNNAAIITDVFPATERGRAIGINQVAGVTGQVIGLVLGGILTSYLGWRSIFWINIPVGIFATAWARARLKELTPPLKGEKVDPLGNSLFALGLILFLLGLTFSALYGWAPILTWVMLLGIAMLGAFVFVELKSKYPMMDFSLFRIRAFSGGVLSNLLASMARGAVSLVLVFYFQGALGLGALTAGILLIPFSIAFVSLGPISGYLSDRYGARTFTTGGLVISAVGLLIFAVLPFDAPYELLAIAMILTGMGGGLFVAPNVASVMSSVPVERRGVASGMSSMLFNTGYLLSLGTAFAVMAAGVPLVTLQAIFAGQHVYISQTGLVDFGEAMHNVFLLMAALSVFAIIPSSLRGSKRAS